MHSTKSSQSTSSFAGNIGFVFFITYFATFSLGNVNENFAPLDIYLKHSVALAAGMISILFFPSQLLVSSLLFSPIAFLYVFADLPQYAFMCLLFSAAIPCFGRGIYHAMEHYGPHATAALFFIFLLPMCIGIIRHSEGVFWTAQYGRPRLLFGYWHPKEAAISLAIPTLFAAHVFRDKIIKYIFFLSPALLFMIGSRGTALGVLFILMLAYFPKATFLLLTFFGCIFLLFLLSSDDAFLALDQISSYRLSLWRDALTWADHTPSGDFGFDRYSIDSFYVEIMSKLGSFSLTLLISWFLMISTLIILSKKNSLWRFALLASIFLISAFDSGLVSTGNAYHVFAWSFAVLPILEYFRTLITQPITAQKYAPLSQD